MILIAKKSVLFFFGLVTGLLFGAGFFIFKMDELIKNVNIGGGRDTIVIHQTPPAQLAEKSSGSSKRRNQNVQKSTPEPGKAELATEEELQLVIDSTLTDESTDSVLTEEPISIDQVIVKKDEMIAQKSLEVVTLVEKSANTENDSLLEEISQIKDEPNTFDTFDAEYWKSPLNYKGYKMTKNKIVLFGISPDENVGLYHFNHGLFMKYQQDWFRLSFTDQFRQFEKLSDPSVLELLK